MPRTDFNAHCPLAGSVYWDAPQAFRADARAAGSVIWDEPVKPVRRRIAGKPAVANDAPERGTHGLLPREWGVVEAFDLDDTAVEFVIRRPGKVIARGQDIGTLTITATLRQSQSTAPPERGVSTFTYRWRGVDRLFTVWSVSPVYGLRSLRRVEITAIHELSIGNRAPVEGEAEEISLTVT